MSFQGNGVDIGHQPAGENLTGKQFTFVKMGAAGWVSAGDGDDADGVLQNKPDTGQAALVRISGVSKLKASAAIVRGAKLAAAADGRGVTATLNAQNVCAKAFEPATAANDVIAVLVMPRGQSIAD